MVEQSLPPLRVLIVSPYPELSNDCAFIVRSHLDCIIYECFKGEGLKQQLDLTAAYEMIIFLKTPELYDFFKINYANYKCSYILHYDQTTNYQKKIEEFLEKLKDRFLHKEFTPVHYKLLFFHGYLPTDLYIRLSDERIITFLKAKTLVKYADLAHLIESGMEYFYIRSKDVPIFKNYSKKNIETFILEISVQHSVVADIFKKFKNLTQDTFPNLNRDSLNTFENHFLSALKICMTQKALRDTLLKKLEADSYFPIHMFMTGFIATRLASFMGSEGRITNTLLAFCGIIHDLGLENDKLCEFDSVQALLEGKYDTSFETAEDLIHHGEKVLKWLMEIECIPDWVSDTCLKHHERPLGKGFPIGEEIKNYPFLTTVFIISHMVFDDLYLARNTNRTYKEVFKSFGLKEFKNGTSREIAIHVELLDIF